MCVRLQTVCVSRLIYVRTPILTYINISIAAEIHVLAFLLLLSPLPQALFGAQQQDPGGSELGSGGRRPTVPGPDPERGRRGEAVPRPPAAAALGGTSGGIGGVWGEVFISDLG